MTHAPSQRTSVGQTRAQLAPRMLAVRMVRAAPVTLPVMIFLMNAGISMPVGQAVMQGASKQKRQRDDSPTACCAVKRGAISARLAAIWSAFNLGLSGIVRVIFVLVCSSRRPDGSRYEGRNVQRSTSNVQRSNEKRPSPHHLFVER